MRADIKRHRRRIAAGQPGKQVAGGVAAHLKPQRAGFVLDDGMGLVAKRLEHIPNSDPPAVRVISDNAHYPAYERTAEEIKIHVGAAMIHDEAESLAAEVRGRDLSDGLPKTISVDTIDVIEALSEPLTKIVEATRRVLEMTPPELVSDIVDRGIIMTGGGSLLKNFDELLRQTTGIPVAVAENAVEAVAVGTGMALDMIPELGDSLVSSDQYIRR